MLPFYTIGFLVFSGGIKWGHWPEMSKEELGCLKDENYPSGRRP